MFIPTTKEEVQKLGWDSLDIILVTGDSYIDNPTIGIAVIGKVLLDQGYRVGIIAQPDVESEADITRLGEPKLFWGVTAGSIDSMVANYTALKKRRKSDDYTPGGINNKRPDRALIVYTNLIRRFFKNTAPIVLGGIEASLRRVAHYDYWSNNIRKPIIFDAKADYLVYGMGEKSIVELANLLKAGKSPEAVAGLCFITKEKPDDFIELPSFDDVKADKDRFTDMFRTFYLNNDPIKANGLVQQIDTRYLVQNPPSPSMTNEELDHIYELDYERDAHPYYKEDGEIRALETIQFTLTTHRGCYGECNFCAIAVHQGRTVQSRSQKSLVNEAKKLTEIADFKGYLYDGGSPTANMYGFECDKKLRKGACTKKRCLYPEACDKLKIDHSHHAKLVNELSKIDGVKKVFVTSGIRYDMILQDEDNGKKYIKQLIRDHVSGQMKIAPEHTEDSVLDLMGKTSKDFLEKFNDLYYKENQKAGKNQFLSYYLIAAHPGCTEKEMKQLKTFTSKKLRINPEQVQVFTPLPSTWSSVMYYTEKNPFTGKKIYVEKDMNRKQRQKDMLTYSESRKKYKKKKK